MSCRTEAGVEQNAARAIATWVPRAATATRLLNRVLAVYGYSGFRSDSNNFLGLVFEAVRPFGFPARILPSLILESYGWIVGLPGKTFQ